MSVLITYLKKEVLWSSLPGFLICVLLIDVIYSAALSMLLTNSNVDVGSNVVLENFVRTSSLIQVIWYFVIAALAEELMFRAPLYLPARFGFHKATVICLVVFAVAFGFAHGGIINIAAQGVGGILLGVVFLKCGGMQQKFFKALLASTSYHALYNCLLAVPYWIMSRV